MDLSVIVPIFNEEDSIRLLHGGISDSLSPLGLAYEVIFVDDGSSDSSYDKLIELADADSHVRVIKLSRNFGQTPAMSAGIDFASGDILITMDGDLQNDPSDIPLMLDKIAEGHDLVAGWRRDRQDAKITRIVPSTIANALISYSMGVPIKDSGCTLKAFRANAIKGLPLYSEMHRFIPAIASIVGAKITQMEVKHHPRKFGVSKYGLSRIYRVLFDLVLLRVVLSFIQRPTTWSTLLALASGAISIAGLVVFALDLDGVSSVIPLGIAMMFGVLSLFSIFIGIIINLIYKTAFGRPDTFLRRAPGTMALISDDSTTTIS